MRVRSDEGTGRSDEVTRRSHQVAPQSPGAAASRAGDNADVDALILDRYLDALLAGDQASSILARDGDAPQPATRETVDLIRRSFVRVHPSFRFEERLSARLAAMAVGQHGESGLGALVPFRGSRSARPVRVGAPPVDNGVPGADPGPAAAARSTEDGASDPGPPALPALPAGARRPSAIRPLLIGGAITSAAVSLAGVAWVARRVVRAPAVPELEGLL